MAQLTEQYVKRVVAAAEKTDAEMPAVRPEDVERITAITSEPDPVLRARKMAAWIAEAKAQIEANSREFEALRREKGDQRGDAKLPPAAEAELRRSVESYTSSVAAAVRQEAEAAVGRRQQAKQGRPPRPGRLKV